MALFLLLLDLCAQCVGWAVWDVKKGGCGRGGVVLGPSFVMSCCVAFPFLPCADQEGGGQGVWTPFGFSNI